MRFFAFAALAVLLSAFFAGCASQPINEGALPDGRAYRGAASPKVIIYEYSDFECPYCGKAQPTVEQVLRAYPNDVQLQFRHFPLSIHPYAVPAGIAAACAEKQGKFWEMHDLLYANQKALADADLEKYAQQVGLDMGKYRACVKSPEAKALVDSDMAGGISKGVEATPMFFVGGSKVLGAQPFDKFKAVIDSELAKAQ